MPHPRGRRWLGWQTALARGLTLARPPGEGQRGLARAEGRSQASRRAKPQAQRRPGRVHPVGVGLATNAARLTTITQPATFTSLRISKPGCIVEALRPRQAATASHPAARPPLLVLRVPSLLLVRARGALASGGLLRFWRAGRAAVCERCIAWSRALRLVSGFILITPSGLARASVVRTASGGGQNRPWLQGPVVWCEPPAVRQARAMGLSQPPSESAARAVFVSEDHAGHS